MCDPVVKLDFTSIIAFEATDRIGAENQIEVELLFKLLESATVIKKLSKLGNMSSTTI